MTVIKISKNKLVLISPIALSQEIKDFLSNQGEVDAVVSPCTLHNLQLKTYSDSFPNARVLVPPRLAKRCPGLRITQELGITDQGEFGGEILFNRLEGCAINETVFYHPASKAIVVGDLLFNITGPFSAWENVVFTAYGVKNRVAATRLFKTTIKDQREFMGSLRKLMAWDFDRIIICHGSDVVEDARERLKSAYYWD